MSRSWSLNTTIFITRQASQWSAVKAGFDLTQPSAQFSKVSLTDPTIRDGCFLRLLTAASHSPLKCGALSGMNSHLMFCLVQKLEMRSRDLGCFRNSWSWRAAPTKLVPSSLHMSIIGGWGLKDLHLQMTQLRVIDRIAFRPPIKWNWRPTDAATSRGPACSSWRCPSRMRSLLMEWLPWSITGCWTSYSISEFCWRLPTRKRCWSSRDGQRDNNGLDLVFFRNASSSGLKQATWDTCSQ